MSIDHSLTYKQWKVKNLPHFVRLKKIKRLITQYSSSKIEAYADFGCSNGFITDLIASQTSARNVYGFDWSENIKLAQRNFPRYHFLNLI